MSRRLRGGLARVFPDHRSRLAVAYRREYVTVIEGLGIGHDALLQAEAGRIAMLRVRAIASAAAWAETVERRRAGRGRRPNARLVERHARRAALDDASAASALNGLRELVGRNGHPPTSPAELLERLKARA